MFIVYFTLFELSILKEIPRPILTLYHPLSSPLTGLLIPSSIVKLLFTTLCFVGLYSVPNLIVMLFNLLCPVFIVGFDCKVCVIERECVKTQAIED